MAKTVLIPQTTFVGEDRGAGFIYEFHQYKVNVKNIKVVFDNVAYNVKNDEEEGNDYAAYGAPWDETTNKYDFSVYPFSLGSLTNPDWQTYIWVQDGNEHTIEVYVEDEPVVTVQKPGVQVLQLDERLVIFDETTGDIVTFDGENWLLGNDGFGKSVMPSKYAVVGTAIVGKDVVAPGEPTPPQPEPEDEYTVQLVPSQTFTGIENPIMQNYTAELTYERQMMAAPLTIKVVFDGNSYLDLPRSEGGTGIYYYGDTKETPDYTEYPFILNVTAMEGNQFVSVAVADSNQHTIEVLGKE